MFSARTETGNGEREDRKNPLQNRKNAPFFLEKPSAILISSKNTERGRMDDEQR